jgi:hypothetical protein
MGRPDASIARLYRSGPDPLKQRRADEILAAQGAFDAAHKAALDAVGYPPTSFSVRPAASVSKSSPPLLRAGHAVGAPSCSRGIVRVCHWLFFLGCDGHVQMRIRRYFGRCACDQRVFESLPCLIQTGQEVNCS